MSKFIEFIIRLLCGILFILSFPFVIIQLLWYGLRFIITGYREIDSPIPFIIVDIILDWYYNKIDKNDFEY